MLRIVPGTCGLTIILAALISSFGPWTLSRILSQFTKLCDLCLSLFLCKMGTKICIYFRACCENEIGPDPRLTYSLYPYGNERHLYPL